MSKRNMLCVARVSAVLLGVVVSAGAPVTSAKTVRVDSVEALNAAVPEARPGDEVVLADGEYRDAELAIHGEGADGAPVLVRAETVGGVRITGASSMRIWGKFVTVQGFSFVNGYSSVSDLVQFRRNSKEFATDCRLTRCSIVDYNSPQGRSGKWVSIYGQRNRVDHCYIAGKTTEGATLVVWLDGEPNHHLIDHNHFGPRPDLGRNGGETIRVGDSATSLTSSATVVEHNLFDACDGEIEVISNKSGDNVYRDNTFDNCAGMLTLRHGDRCLVVNNVFLGRGKRGGGGVRVIGADHVVTGNHMQGLIGTDDFRAALSIMNTQPNNELNGYALVSNARVVGNVVVDCTVPLVIGTGAGERNRTLPPKDLTLTGNLFYNEAAPGEYMVLDEPDGLTAEGNIVVGPGAPGLINSRRAKDITLKNAPGLLRTPDGLPGFAAAGYAPRRLTPEGVGPDAP